MADYPGSPSKILFNPNGVASAAWQYLITLLLSQIEVLGKHIVYF
jgi:hypothetical protein